MSVTRRQFVRQSATLAAAAMGLPMVASSRVLGANEEIRMAVVGCGVRGGTHVAAFGKQPGVRIVAVCDPDRERVAAFAKRVEASYGNRPAEVGDVRQLMDRKDFDVLSVATMQYWHSLPTIWACETGRHVYVEKPLAHFIWEGRQMVNAARKYNRLVQVGTQARSRGTDQQVIEYLRSGQLGKIQYIVCFANKARTPIGKRSEPLPIPETLDYELWCGPARKEPIYRDRIQYDCSFTWNMGDGESCNQGVHEVDVARWLLGETTLPRRVMSVGGRFVFNDAGDVPNTQIIYYDYPSAPILYEVHNMRAGKDSKTMPSYRGRGVDTCVQCEGGYVMMHAGLVYDNQGQEIKRFSGGEDHFGNFIRALRSGKREDLNAEVLEGHLSTNICHAGNISYRLGQRASAADIRAQIGDLPVFQEMFDRYLVHLKAHDVDPGESILGPWLQCDTDNECIQDNSRANELVKGFYRQPFEVPEVKV
ncbi:MAG TPA: Gfo/Idh/MocA family oxidoreductase [Candidatus Anammoximicrobium sp.]|nr:Gfo/Idh/MocA family oxidoreductase [Candidatus Anammoximicrobium sp.]